MRKRLLPLLAVLVVAAVGIGVWVGLARVDRTAAPHRIGPHDGLVTRAESMRHLPSAAVRNVTLTAAPATINLGDRVVHTWAFNGQVPGPAISVHVGDVVRARVINKLPEALTVHWHGIAIRNDMDGVADVTQKAIAPGASFVYQFTASTPGTYFYHPHTGTQLDRGLYGALIVTDATQPWQHGVTLMLDDWIDGTGQTPDDVLAQLKAGGAQMPTASGTTMSGMPMSSSGSGMGGMGGMSMGGGSTTSASTSPLGADTADLTYPQYVINGRTATSPAIYDATPGEQLRLRLVNAGAATPFRVAYGGGRMTVIATDGYPVDPVTTDALIIGMGERYDVLVTVPRSGAFPLVAVAEGKGAQALAVLRAGHAALPMPDVHPAQLDGQLLTLADLHATAKVALRTGTPDRTYRVALTGAMMAFDWGIRAPTQRGISLQVKTGQRIRLVLANQTRMWHPIHLHGHTFQVVTGNGVGPRKDTVIMPAMGTVTVDLIADNPGQWVLHCHNIYHAEVGMMTTLSYVT